MSLDSRVTAAALLVLAACPAPPPPPPEGEFEPCHPVTLEADACDPATATFSLASTNVYYPLTVGLEVVLEGEEDGSVVRVERRVLADTEVVAGVETHVLEARELIDGELFEVARNFYVEAEDGTVCYFGEDVEFFEGGAVVNTDGSWRAGVDGSKPGIIMPANPEAGQVYFQENAPGIAQDMGRIESIDGTFSAGGVDYAAVVTIQDSNPIDDEERCAEEAKLYVPGIGEAGDTVKLLVSVSYAPFEACSAETLTSDACDPATATFTLDSTNPYYPLVVGSEVILEGTEDGEAIRVERRVLAETEVVAGVETHVLEARELVDGELFEVARNFYVEASDGTVCYFGEDVTFFEDGAIVNHAGSWRAGVGGATPGVIMPAVPAVGQSYFQENAPGIAHDMGRVTAVDLTRTLGGVEYTNVVSVDDTNPLETCSPEEKLYAPGVGEAGDAEKLLVSFTPGT